MVFNRFWRADRPGAHQRRHRPGPLDRLEDTYLHGGWLQAWGRPGGRPVPADAAARRGACCGTARCPGADRRHGAGLVRRARRARRPCSWWLVRWLRRDADERPGQRDDDRPPHHDLRPGPPNIEPPPPQAGASRSQVVRGFISAMQATPVQTGARTAKVVPLHRRAENWNPQRETITYATPPTPRDDDGGDVTVRLAGARWLDGRGAWQGTGAAGSAVGHLPMVLENGEWRTTGPRTP